jgi:hypothetical protein
MPPLLGSKVLKMKTSEEQETQWREEFLHWFKDRYAIDIHPTIEWAEMAYLRARKLDAERIEELESIIEKQSSNKCAAGIDYIVYSRELESKIAQLEQTISEAVSLMGSIDKCCGNYDACDAIEIFTKRIGKGIKY